MDTNRIQFLVCVLALSLASEAAAQSAQPAAVADPPSLSIVGSLPPPPAGSRTVMGGAIREVDPVRDRFSLKVSGGPSYTIQYDARTRVFRNGEPISARQLSPQDHASVETTLDGSNVYAVAIHLLSKLPEGECEGQVLSFNPHTRELKVNESMSGQTVVLAVPPGTPIVPVGQAALAANPDPGQSQDQGPADLYRGMLVDVHFTSAGGGAGTATGVDVLATQGSMYVFSGSLSYLDMHAGRMMLVDPRDDRAYEVHFEPSRFSSILQNLRENANVRVTATFDGNRYIATQIETQ